MDSSFDTDNSLKFEEDNSTIQQDYDPMFGIDLLLQASEIMKEKETTIGDVYHGNPKSFGSRTDFHTQDKPELALSGIELIIPASGKVDSKPTIVPIKQHTGISLLLQATEHLKSDPTTSSLLSSSRHLSQHTYTSTYSDVDASSPASVYQYGGDPVDVAISWLEKHLANIDRDINKSWLKDHTYVRPRPFHPRGLFPRHDLVTTQGNISSSKNTHSDNPTEVAINDPADGVGFNNKNGTRLRGSSSLTGSTVSTQQSNSDCNSKDDITERKRPVVTCSQADSGAKKDLINQSARRSSHKGCQTIVPGSDNSDASSAGQDSHRRSLSRTADVSQSLPSCSRSSSDFKTSTCGTPKIQTAVQSPRSKKQTARPVQAVKPIKRVDQTPMSSSAPEKKTRQRSPLSGRPVTRSSLRLNSRYLTRFQQNIRSCVQCSQRRRIDFPNKRGSSKGSPNDRPVAIVRPIRRSRSQPSK